MFLSSTVRPGISYSQITQHKLPDPVPASIPSEPSIMQLMQNVMKMMERVNERLDKLEGRYTGAIPKRL